MAGLNQFLLDAKNKERLINFNRDYRLGNLGGWTTEDLKEICNILKNLHDSLSAFGELFELSRREVLRRFDNLENIIHARQRSN